MENEIFKVLLQNGPWAIASVILFKTFLAYVKQKDKESLQDKKERQAIYDKQIDRYNELVNNINANIATGISCMRKDVEEIKLKLVQGGKK